MEFEESEKRQFEVAQNFLESKLKTQTMKFSNNVMMSLVNDTENDYEAISEAIHQVNEARECISKECKIKFAGIQLVIENKGQMDKQTIEKLNGFGFQYQFGSFYDDENESTTIFGQSPDFWDSDFEEFLKTFGEFKQKKYERLKNESSS